MWYLTIHRWTDDPKMAAEAALDRHYRWLYEQQLAGKVLMAGPTPDLKLGIIVVGHMSEDALHELLRHEPFIEAGYRDYEVIPWDVHELLGIGGFSREAIEAMGAQSGRQYSREAIEAIEAQSPGTQ